MSDNFGINKCISFACVCVCVCVCVCGSGGSGGGGVNAKTGKHEKLIKIFVITIIED